MTFGLLEGFKRPPPPPERDWKGVTTAAYGSDCEKSRNPLIHHFLQYGDYTFSDFPTLPSVPPPIMLSIYMRAVSVSVVIRLWMVLLCV